MGFAKSGGNSMQKGLFTGVEVEGLGKRRATRA